LHRFDGSAFKNWINACTGETGIKISPYNKLAVINIRKSGGHEEVISKHYYLREAIGRESFTQKF
jgi:hypothetical protein